MRGVTPGDCSVAAGGLAFLPVRRICPGEAGGISGARRQFVEAHLLRLGRTLGIHLFGWYGPRGGKKPNPLRAGTFYEAAAKLGDEVRPVGSDYPRLRLKDICLNCELPRAFRKTGAAKKAGSPLCMFFLITTGRSGRGRPTPPVHRDRGHRASVFRRALRVY